MTGIRILLVSGGLITVLMLIDATQSPRWQETTQAKLQLDETGTVVGIVFDGATPGVDDIEAIQRLTTLRSLDLSDSQIDDTLIDAVRAQRGLRRLSLSGTQISDHQLSQLLELSRLFHLDLSRTEQLTEGLSRIPASGSLLELDVSDCPWMTDSQIKQLRKFPGLQSVRLARTEITDEATAILAELPKLQWLDIDQCSGLTDRSLVNLGVARNLKSLSVRSVGITLKAASECLTRYPAMRWTVNFGPNPEFAPIVAQHFAYCNEYPHILKELKYSFYGSSDMPFGSLLLEDGVGLDYSPLVAILPSIETLKLSGVGVDDRVMQYVYQMKNLVSLDLSGSRITDAGCSEIAGMQKLKSIDLSGTSVTDITLRRLEGLRHLRQLNLSQTAITDAGLLNLADVTFLRGDLDLSSTSVTGAGIQKLNGSKVSCLRLADTQIDDADLESLTSWKSLYLMDLSGTQVSGPGLKHIRSAGSQLYLNLARSSVTDETVGHLGGIQNLAVLSLAETRVSGATLNTFATCSLYSLDLAGTTVSDEGMISVCSLPRLTSLDVTGAVISETGWSILANSGIGSLAISPATTPLAMLAKTPLASRLTFLEMTSADKTNFDAVPGFSSIASLMLIDSGLDTDIFAALSRMPKLEQLILRNCTVEPESLSRLRFQEGIQSRFVLRNTNVSEDELDAFRDAFPRTSVYAVPKRDANRSWPD